ncbi:MAG: hypothetical protein R3B39_01645 [Candidatus Paceibacterota bacterium]
MLSNTETVPAESQTEILPKQVTQLLKIKMLLAQKMFYQTKMEKYMLILKDIFSKSRCCNKYIILFVVILFALILKFSFL